MKANEPTERQGAATAAELIPAGQEVVEAALGTHPYCILMLYI